MSDEDNSYERDAEAALLREYHNIASQFRYAVETERRFYLANDVEVTERAHGGQVLLEVVLRDVWVWDVYRPDRFVKSAKIVTFKDLNIEELNSQEVSIPDSFTLES